MSKELYSNVKELFKKNLNKESDKENNNRYLNLITQSITDEEKL